MANAEKQRMDIQRKHLSPMIEEGQANIINFPAANVIASHLCTSLGKYKTVQRDNYGLIMCYHEVPRCREGWKRAHWPLSEHKPKVFSCYGILGIRRLTEDGG